MVWNAMCISLKKISVYLAMEIDIDEMCQKALDDYFY